jgi:putative restriction endonuclease
VDESSNHPQNGLCLRVDLHRLFDDGLITITDDLMVRVSFKLAKTSYYALSGKKITPPANGDHYPAAVAITHRNLSEYRD